MVLERSCSGEKVTVSEEAGIDVTIYIIPRRISIPSRMVGIDCFDETFERGGWKEDFQVVPSFIGEHGPGLWIDNVLSKTRLLSACWNPKTEICKRNVELADIRRTAISTLVRGLRELSRYVFNSSSGSTGASAPSAFRFLLVSFLAVSSSTKFAGFLVFLFGLSIVTLCERIRVSRRVRFELSHGRLLQRPYRNSYRISHPNFAAWPTSLRLPFCLRAVLYERATSIGLKRSIYKLSITFWAIMNSTSSYLRRSIAKVGLPLLLNRLESRRTAAAILSHIERSLGGIKKV